MTKLHRGDFLKNIKTAFPDLRDDVNHQHGLLHLEMHAFRDFVQHLIDSEERGAVLKAFQLLERYLKEGNNDIINAITVSLLEHLNFDDGKVSRKWAKTLMPAALQQQHEAIAAYNNERTKKKTI